MFLEVVQFLIYALEGIGILVIVAGFLVATAMGLRNLTRNTMHENYVAYRRQSVRGLILGLEFLVAADIIKTVAVDYTLESVLMLGMIILIRSFLVFTLHLEMKNHDD
jgi:uncharacterized membrane protein